MYCSLIALPLLLLFSKCSRAAVGEKIKLHLPIFIYLIPKPITLTSRLNLKFKANVILTAYLKIWKYSGGGGGGVEFTKK